MDIKKTITDEAGEISKEVESYVQNKINLTKLQIAEDISRLFSATATIVVLSYFGFFAILMLSLAAGHFLSSLLGSTELGFLIIGSLYIILALIFVAFRKKVVQKPIIKAITSMFFPKQNDYDEK